MIGKMKSAGMPPKLMMQMIKSKLGGGGKAKPAFGKAPAMSAPPMDDDVDDPMVDAMPPKKKKKKAAFGYADPITP